MAPESNMRILYQIDFEVLTSGRFIQYSVLHVARKQLKRVNSFDIFSLLKHECIKSLFKVCERWLLFHILNVGTSDTTCVAVLVVCFENVMICKVGQLRNILKNC